MKTRTAHLMILYFILSLLICAIGILLSGRGLHTFVMLSEQVDSDMELQFRWDTGHMMIQGISLEGDHLELYLVPDRAGRQILSVLNREGETIGIGVYRTGRTFWVYDQGGGEFTGCYALAWALAFFCLSFTCILYRFFRQAHGTGLYTYSTILAFGAVLFLGLFGIVFLVPLCRHIAHPTDCRMLTVYNTISGAAANFVRLTFPLILVFAVWMIVSNIQLIRHEGLKFTNTLSILTGLLLIAGFAVCLIQASRNFQGSSAELRIRDAVTSLICSCYAYFECLLFGSAVMGLRAAKHRPPYDRDFIIILGCGFNQDGTLPPLLRGRAEAAVRFWKEQLLKTGKQAVMIPSGGQGKDEPFAEAEAIRRYLLEQGIPDELILKEDKSTTTLQNMQYSGKLIGAHSQNAKTAFATTGYHVFRSGIWAQLAELNAEGISGKTKWWFWPNAFIREVIGVFYKKRRHVLIGLICLTALLSAVSVLMPR